MEEDAQFKQQHDSEAPAREPRHASKVAFRTAVEPDEMGGDPACWLHLLDDEGGPLLAIEPGDEHTARPGIRVRPLVMEHAITATHRELLQRPNH